MKLKLFAFGLLLVPASAFGQSMNADAFYQRAAALQKKGMMAMFSGGEIKALMTEGKAASAKAREQRLATIAAGAKPRYCPPEGPATLSSDDVMSRLAAIPSADRKRIDMTEAMVRILAGKFPCKA